MAAGAIPARCSAVTETAMKEKTGRIEDAPHATRAASRNVSCRAVSSGGVALRRAAGAIDALADLGPDETLGAMIVKRAPEAPMHQIVDYTGLEGSVDPTKVTRVALTARGSIASLLLTTEAVIGNMPETMKEATS